MNKEVLQQKVIERFTERANAGNGLGAVLQMGNEHANIYRNYVSSKIICKYLNLDEADTVLDFGCGLGRISRHIANKCRQIEAVDVTPAMIQAAKEKFPVPPNVHYQLINFGKLPFPDNHFDKVFTFWVLQHIGDTEVKALLKEFQRVLKPGGQIALFEQTRNVEFVYENWNIHRTCMEYQTLGMSVGAKVIVSKQVMRNPSRGMDIWKRLKHNVPLFLPLLYLLDELTLKRHVENVLYFTSAVVLEKFTGLGISSE